MLYSQIYRVTITANKQTVLDLWKLAINAPTGMRKNPGANSRQFSPCQPQAGDAGGTRHGATYFDRAEREGNNPSCRRDSREGRKEGFRDCFSGRRGICAVWGRSAFQTQVQAGEVPSPKQLRGPAGAGLRLTVPQRVN